MLYQNFNRNIAVLVAEAPTEVAIVWRETGTTLSLQTLTRNDFERDWHPYPSDPLTPVETLLRRIMKGQLNIPVQYGPGALLALAVKFPEGPVHLFSITDGFVHRFQFTEDAAAVAANLPGEVAIFDSPKELAKLPHHQLVAVAEACECKTPTAKPTSQYLKGLFEMATKATKKQSKKVAKVQAKAKRADGPVARVHAICEKAGSTIQTNTPALIEKCTAAGINEATARTQIAAWRQQSGIAAVRQPRAEGTSKPRAKASPKKKAKKAPAKKSKPAPSVAPEVKAPEKVTAPKKAKKVPAPAPAPEVKITAPVPLTPPSNNPVQQPAGEA